MSQAEAHAIVTEQLKWLRNEAPYQFDPDNDFMFPPRPRHSAEQFAAALDKLLALTA